MQLECDFQRLLPDISQRGPVQNWPPADQGLPVPGGAHRPQDHQHGWRQVQSERCWASQLGPQGDGGEEHEEGHQVLRLDQVQGGVREDTQEGKRVTD